MQVNGTNPLKDTTHIRYNPWHPANWMLICKLNVILAALLIVDVVIGHELALNPCTSNYVSGSISSVTNFWIMIAIYCCIFCLSPFLNGDIAETPFLVMICIKILLYLGAAPYTYLGMIAEYLLGLVGSIVIGIVLVLNVFFDSDAPFAFAKIFLVAYGLIFVHFIVALVCFGEAWSPLRLGLFIFCLIGGMALIHVGRKFLGGIFTLLTSLCDTWIFGLNASGFGTGGSIILIGSVILLIKSFPKRG